VSRELLTVASVRDKCLKTGGGKRGVEAIEIFWRRG
jgi:hypothetical protein